MPQNPWAVVKTEPLPADSPWTVVKTEPSGAQEVSLDMGKVSPIPGLMGEIGDALAGFWHKQPIHPLDMAMAVTEPARRAITEKNPLSAAKPVIEMGASMLEEQGKPLSRAKASFQQGDVIGSAGHFVNYLLPIIGPQIDDAQERFKAGKLSMGGFIGEILGVGSQIAIPEAIKNKPPVKIGAGLKNPNPAEVSAVEFGQRSGIPVDAATATGSKFVGGVQAGAQRTSLLGSTLGTKAQTAQQNALSRVGGELADRAHPIAQTAEGAGAAIQSGVGKTVAAFETAADTAYTALRQIEADPKHTQRVQTGTKTVTTGTNHVTGAPITKTVPVMEDVPLAVDLRAVKASLKPIYDRLSRQYSVTQRQASPGLQAIQNILDGPDYAPLSVADADLSAIKALSRTDSAVRNVAQGTAGAAVKALDAQVVARASKAGPDALKALKAGRAATIQKYVASDLLDTIRAEPVGAFRDVTAANDAHIVKLRQIDKAAPGTAAQVGRAYLDSLLNMAQAEGGFQRAAKLQAEWRKLGPETKRLLFKDPAYIQDLDDFFLLAKRIGDNPNPSGSGYMGGLIGRAYLGFDPISQVGYELTGAALTTALHSPAVVKLLTKGMKLPVKSAMGPAWFGSLVAATQAEGIPLEEAKQ